MKNLIVFLVCISISLACENYCNAHGDCKENDKCECYPGWGGSDCNLRSCPYSDAFVDLLPGDLDHDGSVSTDGNAGSAPPYHAVKNEWNPKLGTAESIGALIKDTKRAHRYAECSNAGKCDRNTGLCICNSGFEGSACQRRSCPSSSDGLICSGHGMCLSSEASIIHKDTTGVSLPSGWEYSKFGVCECDKGWSGISCGSRVCAKGLDPVKKGSYIYKFSVTEASNNNNLLAADGKINSHYYEMVYDGITYKTPIIPALTGICDGSGKLVSSVASSASEEIRRALVSIPPLSQAKVSFTCTANANTIQSIDITTSYIELDLTDKVAGDTSSCKKDNANTPYYCDIAIKTDTTIHTINKPSSFKAVNSADLTKIVDIKQLTMTATSMNTDFTVVNGATKSTYTPIHDGVGEVSCSGRGICDSTSGLCQCFDGFTGLACEKLRNN